MINKLTIEQLERLKELAVKNQEYGIAEDLRNEIKSITKIGTKIIIDIAEIPNYTFFEWMTKFEDYNHVPEDGVIEMIKLNCKS